MNTRTAIALSSCALAALSACRGAPEPVELEAPAIESETLHFAGTLLTGPRAELAEPESITPANCYDLDCRVVFVEGLFDDKLEPLGARSSLVFDSRSADPLMAYSPLASGARIASGEEARSFMNDFVDSGRVQTIELERLDGITCAGVTAAFAVRSVDLVDDPVEGPSRRSLTLLVSHLPSSDSAPVQVALLVQRLGPGDGAEPGRPGRVLSRQLVVLEDFPTLDGEPLVLTMPSPFEGSIGLASFVLSLEVSPPSDDGDHVDRVEDVVARLGESTAEAARRVQAFESGGSDLRAMQRGIEALQYARDQRPALIFLAASADGLLSLDLALSADDALVTDWITELQREVDAAAERDQLDAGPELAWRLEQTGWRVALTRATRGQLAPEVEGLLLRHAGQAARFPDLLLDAVAASKDREELITKIEAENRAALTDNDAAARTRAHDWLTGQGDAVPGFDPLASREDRRAALERAAKEASSEESGT